MIKYCLMCAALLMLGTSSLHAQVAEVVLQKIAVPGAGFGVSIAVPKYPVATPHSRLSVSSGRVTWYNVLASEFGVAQTFAKGDL